MDNYYIEIYERFRDLKNSGKTHFDNMDLWRIFEYLSCIELSNEFQNPFYVYEDIPLDFKELHNLSYKDTGIDCCNLIDTIVQCKLRSKNLGFLDCSTFFASQNLYCEETDCTIVKWKKMIITRNAEIGLSPEMLRRKNLKLFIDKPFNKQYIIDFCENLYINPPCYPKLNETNQKQLRDYQIQCKDFIITPFSLKNETVI